MNEDTSTSQQNNLLPPFKGLQKIEVLNIEEYRKDPTMITVILHEEDHTIGNALKHIVNMLPGVEFCGYNVPHPLEDKILFRIQTRKGFDSGQVMMDGLRDLGEVFLAINEKFSNAYERFQAEKQADE